MKQKSIVYGTHTVSMLLAHQPERILSVWCLEDTRHDWQNVLAQKGLKPLLISKSKLEALTQTTQHQGIAAQVHPKRLCTERELIDRLETAKEQATVLVLEGVSDPHNLGACIRTAAAAGVECLILPKHQRCPITPVVEKVACGGTAVLEIAEVVNLKRTLTQRKQMGFWVFGTTLSHPDSKNILEEEITGKCIFVMGAEGTGIKKETLKQCDHYVHIPMLNQIQSLNVSVALGVILFATQK